VTHPLLGGALEGQAQQLALPVPTDHRRVQVPGDGLGPGDDVQEPYRGDGLGLPLQLHRGHHLNPHSVADQAVRGRAQQDVTGAGRLLEPSGNVDGVPRGQRLPLGRIARHDLAGVDAGSDLDGDPAVPFKLPVEFVQLLPHLGGGSYRPERVVLVEGGDPEHHHDGVADELLHGAAVPLDHGLHPVEVPSHDRPQGLRI
jgi:hypothetical protein